MAEVSLAQETRTVPAYVLRGAGLFEVYREQFEYLGAGRWSVPSGTVEGKSYVVRPGRHAQCERQEPV